MTTRLTPARAAERLASVSAEGDARGFAAVVVAPSADMGYLVGYDPMPLERPTLLVLRPDRPPVMLVPELERLSAAEAPGSSEVQLFGWTDAQDPYEVATGLLPAHGRVAVGDRLWASHVLGLQAAAAGLVFEPASPLIGRLRARKDPDELAALRRAGAAADRTFEEVIQLPFAGRRETAIAADLARLLVHHGHANAAFTIVASGPNAASPHHEPGERTLRDGDAVVLDFGGDLDGYYSDTTRTVVVGDAPKELATVHELVRAAQEAACETVRPGATAQDVDRAARGVIEAGGYGDRFIHRTGHGIGLEVHEPPYIIEGNETVLEPGVTFSVEPGVYLEGRFGVRIEDIVAVSNDGVERLNTSPRELRVVS